MGMKEKFGSPDRDGSLNLNSKIKLVISEEEFGRSAFSHSDYPDLSFELVHIPASAPIERSIADDAELLIVELTTGEPKSMQRLTALRTQYSTLPIIVATRDTNLATARMLLRQGINDVIPLPIERLEFEDSIHNLLATRRPASPKQALAPVIAVAQSVGGIGATTVVTHLAHYLGHQGSDGKRCCLIDLDLQFGNAASYLGVSSPLTMSDLLAAGQRVDGSLLQTVASTADNGVAVIAAPENIAPLEAVDSEQLLKILTLAQQEFGYVVMDLPGNWANWTLSAIDKADLILLVVDLSVGSLRQARRRLNLFEETGIDRNRIKIVANRMEKRLFKTISVQDAAEALRYPILATVQSDYPVVQSAHDQGVLVGAVARKNRVATDLAALAEKVAAVIEQI